MKRIALAALASICLASPLAAQAPAAGNDPNRPFSAPLQAGLNALERKHYSTALRAWQPMANSGEPRAQNNMGIMYERGLGVTQSYPEAMSWYRKAADQGLPEAFQTHRLPGGGAGLNHPANLAAVGAGLARILGVPDGDMARRMEENFWRWWRG